VFSDSPFARFPTANGRNRPRLRELAALAGLGWIIFANQNEKGSRKNDFGIRAPIHRFCQRRSSDEYVNVFGLLAS
jgi:hypothetical protein